MNKPFGIKDAFLIYRGEIYFVDEFHNHINYVLHNYQNFNISDDEYDELKYFSEEDDFGLELLNLALKKGAIQVRNIKTLQTTFINLKNHSMIDELVDSILDNSELFPYTMQVNFLEEDDGGIAKNIMELYSI